MNTAAITRKYNRRLNNKARVGVAFLLRLSYLEPCWDRADWLVQHPVSKLIVLPRISFTGDHKTDSVTCGWFVWVKGGTEQQIEVAPRGTFQRLSDEE